MLDSDGNELLEEKEVSKLIELIFSLENLTEGEKTSHREFFEGMFAESSETEELHSGSITLEQWLNSCKSNDKNHQGY